MKKLALILIAQLSFCAFAQTVSFGYFKIVEQEIIYQKVFSQDSITKEALEKYYKTLPYISDLELTSDGVQFNVNDLTVDYRKFQLSQVSTPPIMQTGKYSGKVSIGVK